MCEEVLARDEPEREAPVMPGVVLQLDLVAERAGACRLHDEELAAAARAHGLAGDDDAGDARADDAADDAQRAATGVADLERDIAPGRGQALAAGGEAGGEGLPERAHDARPDGCDAAEPVAAATCG